MQSNEKFKVKYLNAEKCGSCGHIYAVDVATDYGVQTLPDPDMMLNSFGDRNRILVSMLRQKGFLADTSRILDFGAGSGHLLRSLAGIMPKVQISCVEADPTASAFLRSQGFTVHDNLSAAKVGGYDAIVLIELLEHLSDPVGFLKEIKTYLAPGGRIFMSTPIGETRSGNRNLQTYDTPEHVQFWTEGSFALCCQMAGLSFAPCHAGVMYPRKNRLEAIARDFAQTVRDAVQGKRHLVGFLSPVQAG